MDKLFFDDPDFCHRLRDALSAMFSHKRIAFRFWANEVLVHKNEGVYVLKMDFYIFWTFTIKFLPSFITKGFQVKFSL